MFTSTRFKETEYGREMVIDRMTSKLRVGGSAEWTCIQYSAEELTNRKQKYYEKIVQKRKF